MGDPPQRVAPAFGLVGSASMSVTTSRRSGCSHTPVCRSFQHNAAHSPEPDETMTVNICGMGQP